MSEATFILSIAYPASQVPASINVPHAALARVQYTVQGHARTVVPDGGEASDTVSVDLSPLGQGITGFVLRNETAQDLIVAANSDTVAVTLPPGGLMAYAAPADPTVFITALTITLTATQIGDQHVDVVFFGDPDPS